MRASIEVIKPDKTSTDSIINEFLFSNTAFITNKWYVKAINKTR